MKKRKPAELMTSDRRLSLLLFLARAGDAIVDGLAAGKALFGRVPVRDLVFAEFPAKQHDFTLDAAGKIQQPDIDVFHLHTSGMNFGDGVFSALDGALTLRFPAGH